MNHRQFYKEFLRIRLSKWVCFIRPLATFQEHSINVTSILWFLCNITKLHIVFHYEFKAKFINGDLVTTRVVLHGRGQERLWEEESWNPIHYRGSFLVPGVQKVDALIKVLYPRCKRLHWKKANWGPVSWNHIIENWCSHLFKLFWHYYFSKKSSLD